MVKENLNIYQKLFKIQQEIEVPKQQYNTSADFKYRSAEDILKVLKPILKELDLVIQMAENIEQIGNRYYIRSTVTLRDIKNIDEYISTDSCAREIEFKKDMDQSQLTGSASSYARKYALTGLLAIDDSKDPDSDSDVIKEYENKQNMKIFEKKRKELANLAKVKKQVNEMPKIINNIFGKNDSSELTIIEVEELIEYLKSL